MRSLSLLPTKGPEKSPGVVRAAVGYRSHSVSLTGQEPEKMSSITHPQSRMVPGYCLVLRGIQEPRIAWIILACREAWSNEGMSLSMWDPGNL